MSESWSVVRDRERGNGPDEFVAVPVLPEQPGFEHRLRQLLDEQRHAVRLGDDVLVRICSGQVLPLATRRAISAASAGLSRFRVHDA